MLTVAEESSDRRRVNRPHELPRARQRRHAESVQSVWWGGQLPAKPVVGTFYRVTAGDVPGEDDFKSNAERGRRPRDRELMHREEHRAISVYSNPADASRAISMFPLLGRFAVQLVIRRGAVITGRWQPERLRSHWNLWGAPADFLRHVRRVGLDADTLDRLAEQG